MAATDARPVPLKNAAFRLYFEIRKNDGTLITSWAGADSEVSLDGASFADCTNEATEIGTSGVGYIDFTGAEMNADCVVYKLTVTNTDALPYVEKLYPEEAGDIRVNVTQVSGDSAAADNLEAACDGTGYDIGGIDVSELNSAVDAIGTDGSGLTEAGGTGDHLTAIPWNSAWDAEVQSECADALAAYNAVATTDLPDNFIDLSITATTGRVDVAEIEGTSATSQLASQAATGASVALATYDPPTKTEMDAAFTQIKGSTWSASTDTLEAIRDRGDAAWTTATGFSTHSAADVWSAATRTLTANTNLNDPTAAAIADAVWDEALSGHLTAGTTGNALNAAGSAGDPWTTTLPGSYTGSQAGKILADILADTGTTIPGTLSGLATSSALATVDANVDAILVDTGTTLPATLSGLSTLDAAGVRTAVGLASANLDAQLGDLPTVAEFEARTLAAASYATASALATVDTVADGIKAVTDNLPDSGALTTLTTNVASILADTGTDGVVVAAASKTGYALASTGLDAITPAEPSAVPTWGSSSIVAWMGWLGAFSRNKLTQTATTQTLRNDADNADIATSTVSDTGTTFTRGEFS